jgi:riboflavin kinase/FMN adenylyltransferase
MQIHKGFNQLPAFRNAVLSIGTYDGVHAGHQVIIQRLNEIASEINGESVLLTFDPHPRLVLQPNDPSLKLISTIEEKIQLLESFGLQHLVIVEFSKEFASMDAEKYVEDVLIQNFHPKKIIIGYDHRFGKGRTGDIHLLQKLGPKFGYDVEEISVQTIDEISVSSTKVRQSLALGDIKTANQYLAHPFTLSGKVVHGDKIGRTIGFPTANIQVMDAHKLIPTLGVYAVKVLIDKQVHNGALNIGHRPTVTSEGELRIEVYLLDYDGDLYDKNITLVFVDFIRKDAKFESIEALIQQMNQDIIDVRKALA